MRSTQGLLSLLLIMVFCSQAPRSDAQITCNGNLQCVTSLVPSLPPFSLNLPAIPLPDGSNLFDILNPTTLVDYAQSKLPQGAQDSITLGTNLINQLQCGQSVLPIFTTEVITSPGFLGSLSDGSCENINSVPGNSYLVGAMSTKAAAFLSNLTGTHQAEVNSAKKEDKDYAFCLAVDPCNLDFYLGASGISTTWTIPMGALPPVTLEVEFKSISYSNNGQNAGIQQSAIGLWTYDQSPLAMPDGVPILGNLDAQFGANLTWGYVVAGQHIASISMVGDVEVVVGFNNPVSFALQTKAQPQIQLYGSSALNIDFSALGSAFETDMLFYTTYSNPQDWNVYAGVQVSVNLQNVISALPGDIAAVVSDMLAADTSLTVNVNLHVNPDGAGIRLAFTGQIGLNPIFSDIIHAFDPNVPTTFSEGLGVKLLVLPINGANKVFGFVDINGVEWSYGFCSDNWDCMAGQSCYLGVCAASVGCLASTGRNYVGDVSFIGGCPQGTSGTEQYGRCYQDCRSGYTTGLLGSASRICYEDCNCGTELFGASLCSDNFPGTSICNAFTARSRGWYDRTVDNVCPAGSSTVATTCWGNCPSGWAPGTTGDVAGASSALNCYLNNCPADFPTKCLSGLTEVCVKAGVSCSSLETVGALFGTCNSGISGATPTSTTGSSNMMATITPPSCAPGWVLDTKALTCRMCTGGIYCTGGSAKPVTCPLDHYCPLGCSAPVACPITTPTARSGSDSRSQCTVCTPGSYLVQSTTTGASTCQPCPAGAYCPGTDGSITQCRSGYYCPAGAAFPTNCPPYAATYMYQVSLPGASSASDCVPCPSGTIYSANPYPTDFYYTGDINATCVQIQAGQQTFNGSTSVFPCLAGQYCQAGVPALPCPADQWSDAGSVSASQCALPTCPAGTYLGGGGSSGRASLTSCMSCPVGYYCPGGTGLSQLSPIACPASKSVGGSGYSTTGGASSVAQCLSCPAGSHAGFYNKGLHWSNYSGSGMAQITCNDCSTGWCGVVSVSG